MKKSSVILSLLEDISAGNSDAFSRFYDILYPTVYKFSRYFIKSEELCKEIVSDVFFGLWQRRKNLPNVENLENYIFIAIKNQAIKNKSARMKYQGDPLDILPGDFLIDVTTPESALMNKELGDALSMAVNELPERCKLIFLMSREQSLRHKEIAEILSVSEHTVHAQLTIASRKIAEFLEKHFQ